MGAPRLALRDVGKARPRSISAKAFCQFHPLIGKGLLPILEQPHTKSTEDEDQNHDGTNRANQEVNMPTNPTSRTPLLCLPGMRRADAPGLGRTNQQVRRNVPRLRRLLTPKISRRRQPTEAFLMMITEECHREEVQAFATRRPADEGPTHYSPPGPRPDCRVHFTYEGARPSPLGRALPRLSASATSPP